LADFFELPEPTPGSDPSWFGFFFLVREEAPFTRDELVHALEARRIQTRMLIGVNLLRQPAYAGIRHRVVGGLKQTDRLLHQGMWVGVYPGLRGPGIAYLAESLVAEARRLAARGASRERVPHG
jgi:CDP-6-deoxy-D-xylo-4-hexulose-3-dehydrase